MSLDDTTRERIDALVRSHDVMLFMKGNRQAPQCGFSATVIKILDGLVPEYQTHDVLQDADVREGIKTYSSWPTIPQLYVKGEFIGGCDIIQELSTSGELQQALGVELPDVETPEIHLSAPAAEALQHAFEQQGGAGLGIHLAVDARFQATLTIAAVGPGLTQVELGGVTFHLDRMSAGRADGLKIDVVETPQGRGFHIDNPNAPQVQQLGAQDLKRWIDSAEPIELLDVRTPEENARASIPTSILLSEEEARRVEALPKDTALVFVCHHGVRSQNAAQHFASQGFKNVFSVVGGIDAWSQDVDPSVPRY